MDIIENIRDYYNEETKIISMPKREVEIPKEGIGYTLFHSMKKHFGKTALIEIHTHETCTYDDLFLKTVRIAIKMKSMGIKSGDIISICSRNQIDTIATFLSAFFIGAVNASLEPATLSDSDLEYLIKQAEPKMFFVSSDCEKRIEKITTKLKMDSRIVVFGETNKNIRYSEFDCPQTDEDTFEPFIAEDIEKMCIILFSSGSSGLPKAMCFSHKYLCYHTSIVSIFENVFSLANIYWTGTIQLILLQIRYGKQFSVMSKFDPREIWDAIEKYKPTVLQMLPYVATEFMKHKPKDREVDLKFFGIVGSSMSKENIIKIREALPKTLVSTLYAMSETAQLLNPLSPKSYMKVTSGGIPMIGIQYKVVDPETEQNVGFNQKGELRVKSPYQLKGYYKRDSSLCWDEEGYFKTGDVMYFDEDFCFFMVDRIKELFKCKGIHITPVKYEHILEDHPDIHIAVVVGIPHAIYDSEMMAVVVPRKGSDITPEEVEEYFNSKVMESEKITAGVKFMESIPLTPSGKIARNQLKQMMINEMQ